MLYAMLVGLDNVDPAFYPMDNPIISKALVPLSGSEGAAALGNTFNKYYGAATFLPIARAADVIARLQQLSGVAKPGDVVICSYAGHGVFIWTKNADAARFANRGLGAFAGDRRWTTAMVLEDRMMLSDEYNRLLSAFRPGVTVVNIIEACNAGAMLARRREEIAAIVSKNNAVTAALYDLDSAFYDQILADGPGMLAMAGIQFSSTSVGETGMGGTLGSPFSDAIADAIRFNEVASYTALFELVQAANTGEFSPVMYAFGTAHQGLLKQPLLSPISRTRHPDPMPAPPTVSTK